MRILTFLDRMRHDRRGVSILELGLAMPILSVALLGLVDVASCYSKQMSVQQAAARALERVQVSGTTTTTEAIVKTEAAQAAGVPETQVAIDSWLECNSARQDPTVLNCSTGETSAKYIKVTITSSYTPYFAYSPLGTRAADGSIPLTAASSVRTG